MSFSKVFSVRQIDPQHTEGRAVRRIVVSGEALKGVKLVAGDPLVLIAAQKLGKTDVNIPVRLPGKGYNPMC